MGVLTFKFCYICMKGNGLKYKRAAWKGYWAWENDTIMMHCEDGKVLDIRETDDVAFTLENILANDWEVAVPSNCPVLAKEMATETEESDHA